MSKIMGSSSVPDTQHETPPVHRLSIVSDISESSEDERDYYDDQDSIMQHGNDSQSSLDDGLEDMELDSEDYEERCRQSPISRLPAELLIAVFSKISSTADFKSCMLVSKGWARCSVDLLWHRPATGTWKSLMNVMQTTRKTDGFFAYHDLVKRLNLSQLKEQISDGTLVALANCKRIERLTLTDCTKLSDLSVSQLIDGNRNLLAIDISGLDAITDRTMTTVANNCYKLQGLNITKCTRVTDVSLVAVAQNCRRVKRVSDLQHTFLIIY
jgi:F-box and leucine-rich repeat protein GRR1